ncbi:MAG: response regulator [Anaerolineae bacterium]|nr:response regulator [Anaerolineae bacterium]
MSTSEQELMRDLLVTFKAEASDLLQTLNGALLRLEREADGAARQGYLQDAFRAAHSLKGAALAVGLDAVKALAHDMESVLQQARDNQEILSAQTCDALYDALDSIEQLLAGNEVDTSAIQERLQGADGDQVPRPAPAPSADTAEVIGPAHEETIRVSINKLDNLMAEAGELLVSKIAAAQRLQDMQHTRRQLADWLKLWHDVRALLPDLAGNDEHILARYEAGFQTLTEAFNDLHQAINRDTVRLGMVSDRLQDEVRRVRMVPFNTMELALQRTVRDTARSEGKQAMLRVIGSEVELDKRVLEELRGALLHLVRNAVSHGIEMPDIRQAAGKQAEGTVMLTVQQRGSDVRIIVSDDGRGFDLSALRTAASSHNLPLPDEGAAASEVIALAFRPGVTTARHITAMAGRGVGLDVVRQSLETLQGRIEVDSTPGAGATILLTVPLSLSITRGLLVRVGTERYALPLLAIEKIIEPADTFTVEGRTMLTVDGTPLALVPLGTLLQRPQSHSANGDRANGGRASGERASDRPLAVVMNVAEQRQAFLVDDVLTELELAIKPLGRPLRRVRNVAGAALMGDGQPVVILNAADMIRAAQNVQGIVLPFNMREEVDEGPPARILVVDDSITTRTLEKNILEAAGYSVTTATDGLEALRRLGAQEFDVIVADIQMPNMDGIQFTQAVRESSEYRHLPLILVTSLESHEDRERGMLAGADAYIVKRGFDQAELLGIIKQFLL